MKKTMRKKPTWLRWVFAFCAGIGTYLLLALLAAKLILEGTVPECGSQTAVCVCAAFGAAFTGMIAGGGETWLLRGLCAGVIESLGVLCVKGACAQGAEWTQSTTAAVALCIIFGILGSCIFHKRNKKATRKRKTKIAKI